MGILHNAIVNTLVISNDAFPVVKYLDMVLITMFNA